MSHPYAADTIVAVSTPPGAGGIAVLRLSGAEALRVAGRCFRAFAKTGDVRDRHAYYGTWSDPGGEPLDDVVVTAFRAPRSYTGEDVVEVSCHGSVYVQRALLESCTRAGARLARPGEYTERAFLNGRVDLTQAEGVADLIASETAAAHRVALTQVRGGIAEEMAGLRAELIEFAALIELENDFGEEDVAFADRAELAARVRDLRAVIARLIASFAYGRAVREGVAAVIAGRPNAGKSTLLNALLGEDRVIVSAAAGTTRDTVDADLAIEGVRFTLTDTAGLREAADEIEALGVARSRAAVARAAVLVYVWDAAATPPEAVATDLAALRRPGLEVIGVANKMDLNPRARLEQYAGAGLTDERFVPVSARNDMNLARLREALLSAGAGERPRGSAVLTRARHVEALREADAALGRVAGGLTSGLSGDLLALDLRQALHYVGEVTGAVSVDDLLDSIFGSFCIGK